MAKTIKIEDIYSKKGKDMKGDGTISCSTDIISFNEKAAPRTMEKWVTRVINSFTQAPSGELEAIIYDYRDDIRGILEFADKFEVRNLYGQLSPEVRRGIEILRAYKKEFNNYWQEMENKP